jgi:hypothetical protein
MTIERLLPKILDVRCPFLDDPNNERYFGKKENMVEVPQPFTSITFRELLDDGYVEDQMWGSKGVGEIETEKLESIDKTIFVGGFKKISRVPFWMKTYNKGYGYALRTFENKCMKGDRFSYHYERTGTRPHVHHSDGLNKDTRSMDNFLPNDFGMNWTESQNVYHETFWDEDFQCFLWFYKKTDSPRFKNVVEEVA